MVDSSNGLATESVSWAKGETEMVSLDRIDMESLAKTGTGTGISGTFPDF